MAPLSGSLAAQYEVFERLRQSGMGAVYKVRHRLLDQVRVIKVLRSYALGGEPAQARFLQEARVASRLRHPNLAVLHDFAVEEDGDAYLVSELVDGWTLRELLRRLGPPPLSLGLEIARQSLAALGHLHRLRIVHRDVSPDNLMLTRDADGLPLVKLIDLGIAKTLEDASEATAAGVFLGKPRYASPEQFGAGPVDERSDIYSFGVVLYELLTGCCPIAGHDPLSLMAGHLNRPPLDFADSDPEGRIPSDLREILFAALEKRPEDRIPNTEELSGALAGVQARYPVAGEDLEPLFGLPVPAETAHVEAEPSESGLLAADPGVDEVTWQSGEQRSSELLYEPLETPLGPEPAASSPLLFRLALSTAALLVLFVVARGFWWPEPEARRSAPEWAAGPRVPAPAAVTAPPAAQTEESDEPAAEPTLAEDLAVPDPEPAAPPQPRESKARAIAGAAPERERPQPTVAKQEPAPPAERPSAPALSRRLPPLWEEGPQTADLLKPGPGVEEPVPLDFPRYSYPTAARGTGLQVDVRLALLVNERGQVIDARVREGAPPDLGFSETALAVAKRIPFQPATRFDVPGKMWTEVILEFME